LALALFRNLENSAAVVVRIPVHIDVISFQESWPEEVLVSE
jgi:hypothetical protein